ncbi:MAG: NUDIX hydrolase [Minisyncoccia bacterium]
MEQSPSNFWKNIPKKRMGTGALIFNEKSEVLIVKPTYKGHWSVPGGVVDANESPREACMREIKEEIGLIMPELHFICVAYQRNSGTEKGESLQFMFYGGVLIQDTIEQIVISKEEIAEFKFVDMKMALSLLNSALANRLSLSMEAIKKNQPFYLERENADS